jgi:hypothetical protein
MRTDRCNRIIELIDACLADLGPMPTPAVVPVERRPGRTPGRRT